MMDKYSGYFIDIYLISTCSVLGIETLVESCRGESCEQDKWSLLAVVAYHLIHTNSIVRA